MQHILFPAKISSLLFSSMTVVYEPPSNIVITHLSHDNMTLRLPLPTDVRQKRLMTEKLLTHAKVFITETDSNTVRSVVFNLTEQIFIDGLKKFTEYDIRAAYGNGQTFGHKGKAIMVKTRGKYWLF